MAPGPTNPVHLADSVMQENIARSRGVRARVVANDGVEPEHALECVALEPVIEHFPGAAAKEIDQVPLRNDAELAHLATKCNALQQVCQAAVGVEWRLQEYRTDQVHQAVHAPVIRVQPFGIAL